MYVRFLMGYFPYILSRNLPLFNWTRLRDHRQWAISDTHVFNPSMVNTFRMGILPNLGRDGDEFQGVRPLQGDEAVAAIGLQGVNRGRGIPHILVVHRHHSRRKLRDIHL